MKLEYNLINTITSSNKLDAAIINNELEFVDLEGKKAPLNNSLKIRGSVNYSWIKQILKEDYSDTDETHSEAIFNQWNKSYNLNDYSLGFLCSVSDYPTSFILPITKFEIEKLPEEIICTLYFDLGDGYTAETSINVFVDTSTEAGGTRIMVGEFEIYLPGHVFYLGFEHDYGLDELDNYDLADYTEEYAEYTKLHFREMFILDLIAPRVLKDIESNVSNWLIPYYANNNIQSEDLTECNYSKDRPFLPLFIEDYIGYLDLNCRLIEPEHPDYTYKES